MRFKEKHAIYIQIAEMITDNILSGRWTENEKIPSVREMAVDMEVNPNTIARTYNYLQEKGIIQNKRGVGYFVSPDALNIAKKSRRTRFLKTELPVFFKSLKLLDIDFETVASLYKEYNTKVVTNQKEDPPG